MTIKKQLREAIRQSGLTLYRIAKDTDLDVAVVHRFVHDEQDVKLSTAEKLADYFGMRLTKPRRAKG